MISINVGKLNEFRKFCFEKLIQILLYSNFGTAFFTHLGASLFWLQRCPGKPKYKQELDWQK
jgi:hypothetical protein